VITAAKASAVLLSVTKLRAPFVPAAQAARL
jgi:hypothetical protein